jgi:hypothetical protein
MQPSPVPVFQQGYGCDSQADAVTRPLTEGKEQKSSWWAWLSGKSSWERLDDICGSGVAMERGHQEEPQVTGEEKEVGQLA